MFVIFFFYLWEIYEFQFYFKIGFYLMFVILEITTNVYKHVGSVLACTFLRNTLIQRKKEYDYVRFIIYGIIRLYNIIIICIIFSWMVCNCTQNKQLFFEGNIFSCRIYLCSRVFYLKFVPTLYLNYLYYFISNCFILYCFLPSNIFILFSCNDSR